MSGLWASRTSGTSGTSRFRAKGLGFRVFLWASLLVELLTVGCGGFAGRGLELE